MLRGNRDHGDHNRDQAHWVQKPVDHIQPIEFTPLTNWAQGVLGSMGGEPYCKILKSLSLAIGIIGLSIERE
jgi:hypothetical protein